MSENNQRRRGCSRPVVIFFVFAILIVAAFLIVGLVNTCSASHDEELPQEQVEQDYGQSSTVLGQE